MPESRPYMHGRTYWIRYYVRGKRFAENTRTADFDEACAILQARRDASALPPSREVARERVARHRGASVCARCGSPGMRTTGLKGKCRLVQDHNHVTGQVRALVCKSCNTKIGQYEHHYYKADEARLTEEYLRQYDEEWGWRLLRRA